MSQTVAIVGAGIGGLAAAARLARAGRRVVVFEQADQTGGKAASVRLGGYRFDVGPSLLTLPGVFRDFFARLGRDVRDYLEPIPLDPICAYEFADGTRLCSRPDRARFAAELERAGVATRAELEAYLNRAARLWRDAGELFLTRSLHDPGTYFSRAGLRAILRAPGLSPFQSLHAAHARAFADPRAVQLFDRYATYNGSSPFHTPATMRVIPHVECAFGGHALRGGIVALPRALERVARECGAEFRLGARVDRIVVANDRCRGVEANGAFCAADAVVSNADVLATYRRLLNQPAAPEARRQARQEPSSSGLVFLWGMARRFPQLQVHNVFFSGDYRREFAAIFEELDLPAEPTIYVNVTSKVEAADAPPDGENWFVLLNAPRDAGQDWPAVAARARAAVRTRLGRALGCDLAAWIREERVITPADIERDTGSTHGSLYGMASHSAISAFLRHPNRSRRIRGLYFAGGSAHPGGGMPLALLSGTLAAELLERHEP
ncbi:MAG TPA: phytoene desaturase family protein [Kiritimatiellia bacterium]|nr:phytoene desaturase family protein [Kiritimatiellia bacterium]